MFLQLFKSYLKASEGTISLSAPVHPFLYDVYGIKFTIFCRPSPLDAALRPPLSSLIETYNLHWELILDRIERAGGFVNGTKSSNVSLLFPAAINFYGCKTQRKTRTMGLGPGIGIRRSENREQL